MYRLPYLTYNNEVVLAAGVANMPVIPAPGVNIRLRLIGGIVGLNRFAVAPIAVDLTLLAGALVLWEVRGLTLAALADMAIIIPKPGIMLPSNTALTPQTASTVAIVNAKAFATLYYYIEAADV